ncbi:MAG: RHS repeat-associated core domain-containing protein, partial [Ignavibacteriales bacterium]
ELNQLVKSQTGNKQVINSYNGEGTRVAKEVNGDITRFLYEGINVILETNGTGSEKAHNVHGTNLLSRTAAGQTADYFYNGHGDVTLLLSEDGQQLASYYYDAFGNPESVQESVYNPYRYAGYMWDDETGKYYLMARMYDPIIARFMQEDSYRGDKNDPLSLNLYTYCHNEPMMYSDPDGHDNVYAQINNKKIENADSYKTGVYGNLRDMVTGLGGSITWNSKTSTATVKMWNKEENKNYVIKYDAKDKKNGEYGVAKRYEVDAKGKLTYVDSSNFFMKDGNIQAGMWNVTNFAGYADKIEFGKNKGTTNVLLNTKTPYSVKTMGAEDSRVYGVKGNIGGSYGIASGEANAYIGTAKGEAKLITGYEENHNGTKVKGGKIGLIPGVDVRASAKASVVEGDASGGLGNKNAGLFTKGEGSALSGEAYGAFVTRVNVNDLEVGFRTGAEASVVSGGISGEVSLFGWSVEVGVEGSALSAGARAELGVFDGRFKGRAKVALGLGGGFNFSIGPKK